MGDSGTGEHPPVTRALVMEEPGTPVWNGWKGSIEVSLHERSGSRLSASPKEGAGMKWNEVEPVSEIRKIIAKPQVNFQSPWYARKVTRKISVYVTWLFLHTNISANQVTLLQNLTGFLGFLLLCCPGRFAALLGMLLIQLGYVLDCVDGEIARYRKTPSVNGIFMDIFNHVTIIPLIPAGLGFHYYFVSGHSILFPILGLLGGLFCMSPTNLSSKETLIHLLERRKVPSFDYSTLKSPEEEAPGIKAEKERKGSLAGDFVRKAVRYWGYVAHYPGSMNFMSLLVLMEVVVGKRSSPIVLPLFAAYVCLTIAREFLHFYLSVKKNETEKRYLKIYLDLQEAEAWGAGTHPVREG